MTVSNESPVHAARIARIADVLVSCQWVVRREELHADIVAFRPGQPGVWAVEFERRCNAYWIGRNARRNHANGAVGIVFVAENVALAEKIRRALGALPAGIRCKAWVLATGEFTAEFVRNNMERKV